MSDDVSNVQERVPLNWGQCSPSPREVLLWRVELIQDHLKSLEDEVEDFKELIKKLTLEDNEQK